jgi:hypothetical protein
MVVGDRAKQKGTPIRHREAIYIYFRASLLQHLSLFMVWDTHYTKVSKATVGALRKEWG